MFSDWTRSEIIQLVGMIAATIAAIAGVIVSYLVKHSNHLIHQVHVELNDRLAQFLKAARAEGEIKERDRSILAQAIRAEAQLEVVKEQEKDKKKSDAVK